MLPYTENWTFDLQWQPPNSVTAQPGIHGQPRRASGASDSLQPAGLRLPPTHQRRNISYGFNVFPRRHEKNFDGGNTDLRVPYLGLSDSSVFYKAEGIADLSRPAVRTSQAPEPGLQVTAAYTWSHTLDMQSGLGLFFNGNDPFNLHNSYGTSSYDRTHVAVVQYHYEIPNVAGANSLLGKLTNGWSFNGLTVFQSGQPYGAIDYSGAVGGIYYANFVEILDPVLPIKPGMTVSQVTLQGTTGIDPNKPLLNSAAFYVPTLAPGTSGVPCTTVSGNPVCDTVETAFGATGRNTFRGPFQERFDLSAVKLTKLSERFTLRFQADALNLFNHTSFDVPNSTITQYSVTNGVPTVRTPPATFGFLQHTLGGPRTMQFSIHLQF